MDMNDNNKIVCVLVTSCVNQAGIKISPALNQKIVIYNLREISRLPQLPESPMCREPDWLCYNNRLNSFNSNWKIKYITPQQMAGAGFYYVGPRDRVKCLFCSIELDHWEPTDDPMSEHRRVSPLCAFLSESPGYDVCGSYEPVQMQNLSFDLNVQKIQKFLNSVTVKQDSFFKGKTLYASIEARLSTFNIFKKSLNQNIRTACEAGLFYIGNGDDDTMLCFCCNRGLKDWESKDDPWTEHAIWSPSCKYLLLMKGKEFVEAIHGRFDCFGNKKQQSYEFPVTDSEIEDNATNAVERYDNDSGVIDIHSEHAGIINGQQKSVDLVEYGHSGPIDNQSRPNKSLPEVSIETNSICCKICLKENAETMFIPCGHVISCVQCAVTFDHCALCRQPLEKFMRVFVYLFEGNEKYPNKLDCLSTQQAENPVDQTLCKICHTEDMVVAFLPCRHICACFECATKMKKCPVCLESSFAILQVFLS